MMGRRAACRGRRNQPTTSSSIILTSSSMTYFISYVPETGELVFVDKPAKDYRALAEKLFDAEVKFWESVTNTVPPCGSEWVEAAAQYIAAAAQLDVAKAEVEASKVKLVELLGTGKRMEGGGVSLVRAPKVGTVDYTALLQELLPGKSKDEIAEVCDKHRKEGSETLTVRITKGGA